MIKFFLILILTNINILNASGIKYINLEEWKSQFEKIKIIAESNVANTAEIEVDAVEEEFAEEVISEVQEDSTYDDDSHFHDEWISLGEFRISHYCPYSCCNGKYTTTSTGLPLNPNLGIVAVDKTIIPLHSELMIDGEMKIAEDVGGAIKGNKIDVLVSSHAEAKRLGIIYREVFIKK